MSFPLYSLQDISKSVQGPTEEIRILESVNMEILQGENVAIVGSSGSGKTTLLHIMASLDILSSGRIYMQGHDLTALTESEKAQLRNTNMGFVFQFHHLLPEFTTVENVAMQAIIGGMRRKKALCLAEEMLESFGLSHRSKHMVSTLSGGERQRVAIARATLLSPTVLLADEPTGNLDQKTSENVMDTLLTLSRDKGMALIMVTHDHTIAARMGRIFELRSGELYEQASM